MLSLTEITRGGNRAGAAGRAVAPRYRACRSRRAAPSLAFDKITAAR